MDIFFVAIWSVFIVAVLILDFWAGYEWHKRQMKRKQSPQPLNRDRKL